MRLLANPNRSGPPGAICTAKRSFTIRGALATSLAWAFGGFDPYWMALAAGAATRVVTTPLSLFSDRGSARLAGALPELHAATAEHHKVSEAPGALRLEFDLSLKRLRRERAKILRRHAVQPKYITQVPTIAAAGTAIVGLLPLRYAIDEVTGGHVDAAFGSMSEAATGVVGFTADPTMLLAAAAFSANIHLASQRSLGFSDDGDKAALNRRNQTCTAAVSLAVVGTTVVAVCGSGVLPASLAAFFSHWYYLMPFTLGVNATTLLFRHPISRSKLWQSIYNVPALPPTHGRYGNLPTGAKEERTATYAELRGEMTYEMYTRGIDDLETECDRRIRKLLRDHVGLFTAEDDWMQTKEENERRLQEVQEAHELHGRQQHVGERMGAPIPGRN